MKDERHLYGACVVCNGVVVDRLTPLDDAFGMCDTAEYGENEEAVLHQYHCRECGVKYEFINEQQQRKAKLIAQILDRSHPLPDDELLIAEECQKRGRLLEVLRGGMNDELMRFSKLERKITPEFVLKSRRRSRNTL